MKPFVMTILILLAVASILFGIFYLWRVVFSTTPNPPLKSGEVSIGQSVFKVEMATTTAEKIRGLSFRPSLAEGSGMFFTFSPGVQNFWMKDMNFPIDIIWIAGDKVVGFKENAQPKDFPGLYASPFGVDKVLEVNAGTVTKDNIKVGDSVFFGPETE